MTAADRSEDITLVKLQGLGNDFLILLDGEGDGEATATATAVATATRSRPVRSRRP